MPRLARPDPEAMRFGAIVRRLRDARGWTLIDFGRKAGMNPTYLGFLERGENIPSLSVVLKLARIFGVEASDMIAEVTGSGKPTTILS
jgi:transcriptional regulator with XRE-family HTH domain